MDLIVAIQRNRNHRFMLFKKKLNVCFMREILLKDQRPEIITTICGHPHTSSYLAFADPGKVCLIYFVSDIQRFNKKQDIET